jgi:S-DNA-T family DNA segregation ATPase FtsK/SpoIIIE
MAFVGELAAPLPGSMRARLDALLCRVLGCLVLAACAAGAASLFTWSNTDPSFTHAASGPARNALGPVGAIVADLAMQLFGLAAPFVLLPPAFWGVQLGSKGRLDGARARLAAAPFAVALIACAASALPRLGTWPLPYNLGGFLGDHGLRLLASLIGTINPERGSAAAALFCLAGGLVLLVKSLGLSQQDLKRICPRPRPLGLGSMVARWWRRLGDVADRHMPMRREPVLRMPPPPFHRMDPVFELEAPMHHPAHAYALPPAPDARDPRPTRRTSPEDVAESRQARELAKRFAPGGDATSGLGREVDPPSPPDLAPRADDDPIREAGGRAPHRAPDAPDMSYPFNPGWSEPPPSSPADWPPNRGGSDELYGRAVAAVLADRKASNEYLRSRLRIRYMRAQDLLERMEQEGIVGAPVYNGMRPILVSRPGTREV